MKKEAWQAHIDACDRSGQTRMAYAKANTLVYSQLLYWDRKLSGAGATKAPGKVKPNKDFVPVDIKKPSPPTPRNKVLGVLEFPNGTKLLIHDSALLANLPALLRLAD